MVLKRVPHLKIIAKDIIETYLERVDTCGLNLPLLYFHKVLFAAITYGSKFVKLLVKA